MEDLLDKRLVFVTGKGGVGKSTVAAALGLVAARRGLRTMVAEVSRQDRVARAFQHEPEGFEEVELASNLFTISIDPQHALEEYLRIQAKRVGPVSNVLASSRTFQYFAAATPGMREMLTIGKVWELAQMERRTRGASRYDLVIVDAPASGHGLGFLRAPKTFAEVARVGPIAHQARTVHGMIVDRKRTAVAAVALPEEMPISETLSLSEALDRELGLALSGLLVNAVHADRFSEEQAEVIGGAIETAGTAPARAALRAALSQHLRAQSQREQVERLREGLDVEPVLLPFVFAENGERAVFERLADALEEALP